MTRKLVRDSHREPTGYALTAAEEREQRARDLLDAGVWPERVAEETGLTLAAVYRLAGTVVPERIPGPTPRPYRTGPMSGRGDRR